MQPRSSSIYYPWFMGKYFKTVTSLYGILVAFRNEYPLCRCVTDMLVKDISCIRMKLRWFRGNLSFYVHFICKFPWISMSGHFWVRLNFFTFNCWLMEIIHYYCYYYYRWHRLISRRFNHYVVKLKYDIRSAFWFHSTWGSLQKEDLRMWWVDQRSRSS